MKAGFAAILGKPNAGKSTLINALVGEKVAIVSWHPQTTRDSIKGILNGPDYQIVFIDTPGLHKPKDKLSEYMMKTVDKANSSVDAVIYVIDGEKGADEEDIANIRKYSAAKMPVIVAVNKEDVALRERMVATLTKLNGAGADTVVPMSAKKADNLAPLIKRIVELLPENDRFYPEDLFTDKSMRFMASEIIREKALFLLSDELPYGICVDVRKYEEKGELTRIEADIVCERESHKPIIVGKGGSMLKEIGSRARADLEKMIGTRVYLGLWVRVEKNWREDKGDVTNLGYNIKNED